MDAVSGAAQGGLALELLVVIFLVIREPVALHPGDSGAKGIFLLAARRISESIGRAGPWLAGAVSDAAQGGLALELLGLKSGLLLGVIFPVIREPVALRPGDSGAEGIFSLAARRIFESIGRAGPKLAGAVSGAAQGVPALTEFAAQSGLTLEQLGLKSGLLLGVIFS